MALLGWKQDCFTAIRKSRRYRPWLTSDFFDTETRSIKDKVWNNDTGCRDTSQTFAVIVLTIFLVPDATSNVLIISPFPISISEQSTHTTGRGLIMSTRVLHNRNRSWLMQCSADVLRDNSKRQTRSFHGDKEGPATSRRSTEGIRSRGGCTRNEL